MDFTKNGGKPNLVIVNKFKNKDRKILIRNSAENLSYTVKPAEKITLPFNPEESDFLDITMEDRESLSSPCWIELSPNLDYRFVPAGETDNSDKCLKIPDGPAGWKLKLKALSGSADDDEMGHNHNVTVGDDKEGIEPVEVLDLEKLGFRDAHLLTDFLKKTGDYRLSDDEKTGLVKQALTLIGEAYVHLPFKKSVYAVDPVQELKHLLHRAAGLDDRTFHNRMLSIFIRLRDLHTNYFLPDPYPDMVAFLPFLVEKFYDERKEEHFMVSKIFDYIPEPNFVQGVIITHWNGIPIKRAVELNGERNPGGNESAREALGIERMTIRPLDTALPPDEEWVDITYIDQTGTKNRNLRFKWQAATYPKRKNSSVESTEDQVQSALGIDIDTEIVRRMKKQLFLKSDHDIDRQIEKTGRGRGEAADIIIPQEINEASKVMPDIFAYRTVARGQFGYIRIYSFDVDNPDAFVEEFINIIDKLPGNGLIIDVRGNGGGLITAGEKLLQVLTGNTIEPARFHFLNTPLMKTLCTRTENTKLLKWGNSIKRSVDTGAVFSQGLPLEEQKEYNRIGRKYHGPVALITDALCYSTTDIFAAGFKDHEIGTILGIDRVTGGGGANVWSHERLRKKLPGDSPLKPLPQNADFRIAVRRTTRVGKNIEMPLEDLGVVPDKRHYMTANDLLNENEDLIAHAVSILESGTMAYQSK